MVWSSQKEARNLDVHSYNGQNDTIQRRLRVVGVITGDIERNAIARTKYGTFFAALRHQFPLLTVYDARLHGSARLLNALVTFHPEWRHWRQRFYKNVPAFRARSERVAAFLRLVQDRADVVLQVGVLFDAAWGSGSLPNVIYTDYTAQLSAQRLESGRSPFTPAQRMAWIGLERQAYARAKHVCTRSEFVRRSIIHDYGIAPGQVTVIGGGANIDPLPAPVFHVQDQPPTVLFIGTQFYRKGGDLLLRAFAQARAHMPQARLVVVTSDPIPGDLPRDGVEVLPAIWNRTQIAALYQRANVFVLPSRQETWGDVLLEAMAYGLPCIGVAGEAMPEIIEHEQTGLIVPPGDVSALAAALVRLLSDAPLRREWGRAGRQRLETKWTWPLVVDRLAPLLYHAANRPVPQFAAISHLLPT